MSVKTKSQPTTKQAKNEKPIVKLSKTGELNLQKWIALKREIDKSMAACLEIEQKLKAECIETYVQVYESMAENPGSIIVLSSKNQSVMFTPKENLKIKEKDYFDYLHSKYKGKATEKIDTCTIDPKLFKKHEKAIKAVIESSKDIPKEDKKKLLVKSQSYQIKKGSINEMFDLSDAAKTTTERIVPISEVFDDLTIVPSLSIKEI